jgi:hypothetical protein
MRAALSGVGVGRKRAAHGITVWDRDWPTLGRFAWSCSCGARYTQELSTPEAASAEGRAHLNAATRAAGGAS